MRWMIMICLWLSGCPGCLAAGGDPSPAADAPSLCEVVLFGVRPLAGHEKGLWPILAKRYRQALHEAKSSLHPLIVCIAADLEGQPYVYLAGQERP